MPRLAKAALLRNDSRKKISTLISVVTLASWCSSLFLSSFWLGGIWVLTAHTTAE